MESQFEKIFNKASNYESCCKAPFAVDHLLQTVNDQTSSLLGDNFKRNWQKEENLSHWDDPESRILKTFKQFLEISGYMDNMWIHWPYEYFLFS